MGCALFRRYPALEGRLPHRPLGLFPTAIERVRGLLPGSVDLWVKREDQSGAPYGGNKVRKLEFLLADGALGGRRRLLTFGGYGSHHVLALALYGRSLGLTVEAVVVPQPMTAHVRDTTHCAAAAGARLYPSAGRIDAPLQLLRALCSHRADGPALRVPPGGSSPRGTLGWLSGGLEIAEQVAAGEAPRFDVVYAALGSGGTVAGLWLGLGEAAVELVAVRVAPWPFASGPLCRRLARRTGALLTGFLPTATLPLPRPRLRVDGEQFGPGYGYPTEAAQDAVRRAEGAGLQLETTYTGKVLGALLLDAAAGRLDGKRVLLPHSHNSRDLSALRAAPVPLPPRLRRAE